jgi:hypothetical protein
MFSYSWFRALLYFNEARALTLKSINFNLSVLMFCMILTINANNFHAKWRQLAGFHNGDTVNLQ